MNPKFAVKCKKDHAGMYLSITHNGYQWESLRKKEINGHIIEEFCQHGEYPVYVDNELVNISFDYACVLAENKQERGKL